MTTHPIKMIEIEIFLAQDRNADLEQPRDEPAPGGEDQNGKRPEPAAGTMLGQTKLARPGSPETRTLTRHRGLLRGRTGILDGMALYRGRGSHGLSRSRKSASGSRVAD